MKQKIDIDLKNCEIKFEDNNAIIVEHTKDADLRFDLVEDIFTKFQGQMFSIKLSTTNDMN